MAAISRRVILAGPGGAGKTTLARQIGAARSLPFFDLDEIFCEEVQNIRRFIADNGYAAYSRRNGELLSDVLLNAPARMVLSLSSGVLSEDVAEPMRSVLVTAVKRGAAAFLVVPHPDDEVAARIVATRQIGRGYGLQCEPERLKYLQRIAEYRQLGFPELRVAQDAPGALQEVLDQIETTDSGFD